MRIVDGREYSTFQAAAAARGLLLCDGDWVACFHDAPIFATGQALRLFFVAALTKGPVTDPLATWTAFAADLCDDLHHVAATLTVSVEPDAYLDYSLYLIDGLLAALGRRLTDFGLPLCQ